jgi:ATP-dependent Lhr-like helicase
VALRRGLPPSVAADMGRLDPEAIAAVVEEARPDLRNADELHDLLLDLGRCPRRMPPSGPGSWTS